LLVNCVASWPIALLLAKIALLLAKCGTLSESRCPAKIDKVSKNLANREVELQAVSTLLSRHEAARTGLITVANVKT
jgi:hypothetical protein